VIAPPTSDDTAEAVAWARHLEQTRDRPRVRGEESLLVQLVMQRLVVAGIVAGAPVAVLLVHLLAPRGSAFAFAAGVGSVLVVVAVAAWCAAPTIAGRWYHGRRTWWLLDGRIVAGRRRARPLQLLVMLGVLTWSLAGLVGALVAADVFAEDAATPARPVSAAGIVGPGESGRVFLVPELDRDEEAQLPGWAETILPQVALFLVAGSVAGVAHASRYR
jgi:hypothetical protein